MIYLSKILVIGPLAEDRWIWGKRLSNPDGKYPLLVQEGTKLQAGCAGSVAVNLARLGNEVTLTHSYSPNPERNRYAWPGKELEQHNVRQALQLGGPYPTSTKQRFVDSSTYEHLLRADTFNNQEHKPGTLEELIEATKEEDYDAIYIADYEAYTLEDGIASAKTLGEYCDWLADNYKGITISDSRRVVYNTQWVKTNHEEWAQILDNEAWHRDQDYIVSKGSKGVSHWKYSFGSPRCFFESPGQNNKTISTCGAGDVLTSVFLDRALKTPEFKPKVWINNANYWASESTTRPYTCRVSLKATL